MAFHATTALAEIGVVPKQAADAIWEKGRDAVFDVARIDAIEAVTKHDVIAFLTHLAEIVGPPFAGLLIGHALAGWYTLALVLGCVGAAAVTLAVERRLSPAVNGLGAPREPDVAGELALEVQRAKLSGE